MDFERIVNAAAEAIFVLDRSGNFSFINKHAIRQSGYSKKDIIGKNALRLIPKSHWKRAMETFSQILLGRVVKSVEYPVRYKSGKVVIMEFTGKPLSENGKIVGAIGTARDITKRKELEEGREQARRMLRFIIDSLPMRVFWKGRSLRYLGCNRAFAEDAGYHSPSEIIGKTDFEMAWKKQARQYRRDDRYVIRTGREKLNYEEPQASAGGKLRWLRTSKRPLRGASGKVIGVLGVYEDITKQKGINSSLKEKIAELERFQRFSVGRELRMVELKKKLRECKKR